VRKSKLFAVLGIAMVAVGISLLVVGTSIRSDGEHKLARPETHSDSDTLDQAISQTDSGNELQHVGWLSLFLGLMVACLGPIVSTLRGRSAHLQSHTRKE